MKCLLISNIMPAWRCRLEELDSEEMFLCAELNCLSKHRSSRYCVLILDLRAGCACKIHTPVLVWNKVVVHYAVLFRI